MERERFELLLDTLYSMITMIRKHFLPGHDFVECGGVTRAHFPLLFMLYSRGSLTMTESARNVGLSKPHMTLQVEKLVEAGLMERVYDPADRRLVTVRLTEKGRGFVIDLKNRMREKAAQIFAALPDEELEKTLNALLTLEEVMAKVERHSRDSKENRSV